jgi:Transglutaminase-like superfamily
MDTGGFHAAEAIMMERWQKFWRLSGYERGIVLEATGGLLATWLGLRLVGFRRWKSVLAWLVPSVNTAARKQTASQRESAELIARMEAAAARNVFFGTNCLEQSLVLWWLLRRRGISAELRIGARKEFERFEAHAWVELDSAVLNDRNAEHLHFVPFDGPISPLEARTE